MFNVAGINALMVYCGNYNPKLGWRNFLKNTSWKLVSDLVYMHATCSNILRKIRDGVASFLGTTIQGKKPQTGERIYEMCYGKDRKLNTIAVSVTNVCVWNMFQFSVQSDWEKVRNRMKIRTVSDVTLVHLKSSQSIWLCIWFLIILFFLKHK